MEKRQSESVFDCEDILTYVRVHRNSLTFPEKLMLMLIYVEREYGKAARQDAPITWIHDGTAFMIHNKDVLVSRLLPGFFGKCKYQSFTRKLYRWGFRKLKFEVESSRDAGTPGKVEVVHDCFEHDKFQRNKKSLLYQMESMTSEKRSSQTNEGSPSHKSTATYIHPADRRLRYSWESFVGSIGQPGGLPGTFLQPDSSTLPAQVWAQNASLWQALERQMLSESSARNNSTASSNNSATIAGISHPMTDNLKHPPAKTQFDRDEIQYDATTMYASNKPAASKPPPQSKKPSEQSESIIRGNNDEIRSQKRLPKDIESSSDQSG